MIKINLLPGSELKKGGGQKASTPVGSGFNLFAILILVALGGVGFLGYTTYQKEQDSNNAVLTAANKVETARREISRLRKEYEELVELSDRINAQFAIVQALANPESRLFWSEKVNMLAALRTALAVYITRMELKEEIEDRETPESIARRDAWQRDRSANKGPQPRPVRVPVIKQRLELNVIAYGTDTPQRLRQIRLFLDALQNFKWSRRSGKEVAFMDNMNPALEVGNQRVDNVAGVEVTRFSIIIRALEQTVDSPPVTPPAPAAPAGRASVNSYQASKG